jgi:hypothetical protein
MSEFYANTKPTSGGREVMPPDAKQALAMLEAFNSVGATVFDVTLFDIEERQQGFQSGRGVDELKRTAAARLEIASRSRNNIVIRPRSTTALLIQLDDLNDEKAGKVEGHAFMIVRTSAGNNQAWLAVSDGPRESDREAAKQFRKRVRAGAGADRSATGATRLAGSLNIKPKYAPDFPVVTVSQVNAGRTISVAILEAAGLIAPAEAVTPAAQLPDRPQEPRRGAAPHSWPDYQRALRGAPMGREGGGPDRSLADFMWSKWAVERGWSIEETAAKLAEVSDKAREKGSRDKGYALLTARNAAAALDRERGSRHQLKPQPLARS